MPNKTKKTVVLLILDGWGVGNFDESNPIYFSKPEAINNIQKNYPGGGLKASGIAVGLPWESPSSSKLGHFIIGSGRVLENYSKEIVSNKTENLKLDSVPDTLSEVISRNNKIQMHIAEEVRYKNITYFFNGLREESFQNEYRIQIPSEKNAFPENNPEMSVNAITDRIILALQENAFDFIVANYANPDVIASTGNYEATIKAIKAVDKEIQRLLSAVLEKDYVLIITSSHGNAESVLNLKTGKTEKNNNDSPVPFYLVKNEYKLSKPKPEIHHLPSIGIISDVAPTILELLKIQKPKDMSGESLFPQLL